MEYILTALFIAIFALLLGLSGARGQSNSGGAKTEPTTITQTKSFSRNELRQRLVDLSKSTAPTELATGAMCYRPAALPKKADYNCAKCGEKTIYSLDTAENKNETSRIIGTVETTIPNCRRTLKTIKGIDISFDETQFCKKCSPDVKSPKLILTVNYEEGKQHRVEGITNNDLILISEFLAGSDKHKDEGDFESPLKDHIKRLSELLGVEIKLPEKESK